MPEASYDADFICVGVVLFKGTSYECPEVPVHEFLDVRMVIMFKYERGESSQVSGRGVFRTVNVGDYGAVVGRVS